MRLFLATLLLACSDGEPPAFIEGDPPAVVARPESDARTPDLKALSSPAASPEGSMIDRAHVVLHVGDSMVGFLGGLQRALDDRFTARHIHFYSRSWTSANILSVDEGDDLDKALSRFHPDLVLFSLGTNNVSYPNPEGLMPHVASLVRKLSSGGRACVWIGPPTWRPDRGLLVPLLKRSVAPCKYFDSQDLELERQTDDVHPTDLGGEIWADAVWRFLEDAGKTPREEFLP